LKNGIATGDINSYIRIGLETNQQFSECSITNTETQEEPCTYQFTQETFPQGYKCNGISSVGDAGDNKCQFDILLRDSRKFSHFFFLSSQGYRAANKNYILRIKYKSESFMLTIITSTKVVFTNITF
jgi:hypothetical protein